jgi:hypothetical protein
MTAGRRARGGLGGLLAAGLVVAGITGSCSTDPRRGYSFSSAHSKDIRTVAVPVFKNTTYSKAVEVSLTEAVISEIRRTTPWSVTSSEDADAVLTGTITESSMRPLSIGRQTGIVEQLAVKLTVDFDFTDNRTGKDLVSRTRFSAVSSFVPAQPAGERLETGQNAAIQDLARDIVAEIRADW